MEFTLLIIVVLAALVFEYINGFHDAANAIATVVSTRVLTPRKALLYGAGLNFFGAFCGTHVASTIGKGLIDSECTTQLVILSALLGAIIWNLITWHFGIPSSSSHALIGGLLGAASMHAGVGAINFSGLMNKVVIPMVTSPLIGFVAGFILMAVLLNLFYKSNPCKINKHFKRLQILSAGIMAFSHGSNDSQKTMGIITLALFSAGFVKDISVPTWVIFICAFIMALGTMGGGWKIIKTIGSKVIKLKPIHGFAAETASAGVILTASSMGIPLSTTHVISTAIMGVGSTLRVSAVKWGVVGNIVIAWIVTLPICMVFSAGVYFLLSKFI